MKYLSLIVFLALCVSLSSATNAQSISGTWTTAPSNGLTARSDFTAAVVKGKIYVIGGRVGNTNIDVMNVYDPTTDIWSTPVTTGTFTPRWGLCSIVVDSEIYVLGGTASNLQVGLNTLEVFDPATNRWSTPTTTGTFTGRAGLIAEYVNGNIYAIGGYNDGQSLSTLEAFDPSTNTWSTPTTTGDFTGRDYFSSAVANNQIYVIGGQGGLVFLSSLQVFDPATNAWSTPATSGYFATRGSSAAGTIGGKIYVVGGENDTFAVLGGLQVFDPATNGWSTVITTDSVIPRRDLAAVVLDGNLYAIGGVRKVVTDYSNDNQYFTPASSAVNTPSSLPSLTLSPNPTDGIVTMRGMPVSDYEVRATNALGAEVLRVSKGNSSELTIDLSRFAPGMYFVRLISSDSIITETVIKE